MPGRVAASRQATQGPDSSSPAISSWTRTPTSSPGEEQRSHSRRPSTSCCGSSCETPVVRMSRGQIIDHVWDYDFDGESTVVETFVSSLRKKVESPELAAHPHRTGRRLSTPGSRRMTLRVRLGIAVAVLLLVLLVIAVLLPRSVHDSLVQQVDSQLVAAARSLPPERAGERLDPTAVREPTWPTGHPIQRALRRADHGQQADGVRRPRGRGRPNARHPGTDFRRRLDAPTHDRRLRPRAPAPGASS